MSVISFGVENVREAEALANAYVNGSYHPELFDGAGDAWMYWNVTVLAIFVIELLMRVICYQQPWTDIHLWVDFLCVVPLAVRVVPRVMGASSLRFGP